MPVCGNCGAPLDLNEDGACRWCHAKVRARRPRSHSGPGDRPPRRRRWNWGVAGLVVLAAAALAVVAGGVGLGISSAIAAHQSGPPAATVSGPSGAVPGVPPASTDLQALRADFGPWRQLSGRVTDDTALVLLESGAAYASERWTVPAAATGWAQDLGGNVASVIRTGDQIAVTDPDGVVYTVGINQAFIISGNPGTVLLISPAGTVLSMSLAQATAVRQPLTR